MEQHPSNSMVQIYIEKDMLAYLMEQNPSWQQIGWSNLSDGRELAAKVKPDAVWVDVNGIIVIAECYARIGKLKPGHRRKIATDILKLISLRDEYGKENPPRLLLVVPEELAYQLEDDDWLSIVIRKEKVEVFKVHLNNEQRNELLKVVKLQADGQAHSPKTAPNLDSQENLSMSLENEFHHAMIGVADFANAHGFGFRFRQMLGEYGGLGTAKRLLAKEDIQTGLWELSQIGSLDHSMEAYVIKEHFQALFTPEELTEAFRRLEELGYSKKI
jgi:hypothetical protein